MVMLTGLCGQHPGLIGFTWEEGEFGSSGAPARLPARKGLWLTAIFGYLKSINTPNSSDYPCGDTV